MVGLPLGYKQKVLSETPRGNKVCACAGTCVTWPDKDGDEDAYVVMTKRSKTMKVEPEWEEATPYRNSVC